MRLPCWLLVIACMAMIFTFSAQNGEESGGLSAEVTQLLARVFRGAAFDPMTPEFERAHHLVRKMAHATVYGLLSISWLALLHTYSLDGRLRYAIAVGVCFVFACSDEFHQTFLVGRSGLFSDVLIDTGGALVGSILFFCLCRWIILRLQRRKEKALHEQN